MASHLTITSGSPGSVTSRNFASRESSPPGGESGGMLGLFAALLNGNGAEAAPASARNGDKANPDLAGLFQLGLEAAVGEAGDGEGQDAEAIAAALDLQTPDAMPVDSAPMTNFIDALTALKASLDRGEPLDPDLLAQVEEALNGLAEALELTLEELAVPDDFAALLEGAGDDKTGLAGTLTQLLSPLAQSLAGAQPADDAAAISEEAAAQAQLKSLGDKLAALLAALEQGEVSAEKLAAIGMAPGGTPTDEIEAALARFAATMSTDAPAVPDEPALATPTLKTSEPVLTGKPVDTPAPASRSDDTSNADDTGRDREDRSADRPVESPRREARPNAATAAAAPADPAQTTAAPTPASPDAGSLRTDPAAGPRVIQAGYQTSQQQLNLPQIAFELARQVQDGNTRFQIRLDPPELGRIDVRLDIDQAGQVNARLTVEKSETLDLMQRDQRALERALQQAGLDSGKTNLEFSLKQNPFAGQSGQQDRHGQGGDGHLAGADLSGGELEEVPPTVNLYRGALQASGVNIIA